MTKTFKIGDKVVVAGKFMQIEAIIDDKATCVWFDKKGELNRQDFPIQMLGEYTVAFVA